MAFVVPDVCVDDLAEMAIPELATEFTLTLSQYWQRERARFTDEEMPSEMLYMLLDSLASVVLVTEEGDA